MTQSTYERGQPVQYTRRNRGTGAVEKGIGRVTADNGQQVWLTDGRRELCFRRDAVVAVVKGAV